MTHPVFATFSPIYRDSPQGENQRAAIIEAFKILQESFPDLNHQKCTTSFHDDLLVLNKNHGFLSDPNFLRALEPFTSDAIVLTKLWRIYIFAIQALDSVRLNGAIVDLGCYDCKTIEIALRYIYFELIDSVDGRRYAGERIPVYMYDAFENPPTGKKANHGPALVEIVQNRMSYLNNWFDMSYRKGLLPKALSDSLMNIPDYCACFVHIDLNSAECDSQCLELIYELVSDGGVILLDDYGFLNYHKTMEKVDELSKVVGFKTTELPTGQGLIIKRAQTRVFGSHAK